MELATSLIEKLLTIQKKQKLSDLKMSKKLKVSRQRWQQIRTNPKTFTGIISPIQTGILENFPELTVDLIGLIKDPGNGNGYN
jgi:hypothetical protein